jgi:hypothetical protein
LFVESGIASKVSPFSFHHTLLLLAAGSNNISLMERDFLIFAFKYEVPEEAICCVVEVLIMSLIKSDRFHIFNSCLKKCSGLFARDLHFVVKFLCMFHTTASVV